MDEMKKNDVGTEAMENSEWEDDSSEFRTTPKFDRAFAYFYSQFMATLEERGKRMPELNETEAGLYNRMLALLVQKTQYVSYKMRTGIRNPYVFQIESLKMKLKAEEGYDEKKFRKWLEYYLKNEFVMKEDIAWVTVDCILPGCRCDLTMPEELIPYLKRNSECIAGVTDPGDYWEMREAVPEDIETAIEVMKGYPE